jgi:hypothetical protein
MLVLGAEVCGSLYALVSALLGCLVAGHGELPTWPLEAWGSRGLETCAYQGRAFLKKSCYYSRGQYEQPTIDRDDSPIINAAEEKLDRYMLGEKVVNTLL